MTPYAVFWLEAGTPCVAAPDTLVAALAHAEALRARRRQGEAVSHIVLAVEDPHHVGESGVAAAADDYDWTKRRVPASGRPRPVLVAESPVPATAHHPSARDEHA